MLPSLPAVAQPTRQRLSRPAEYQLQVRASWLALTFISSSRNLAGHVDVHAGRYQCGHELRALRSGVGRECRAEGEPGDECLAAEPVAKQLQ